MSYLTFSGLHINALLLASLKFDFFLIKKKEKLIKNEGKKCFIFLRIYIMQDVITNRLFHIVTGMSNTWSVD